MTFLSKSLMTTVATLSFAAQAYSGPDRRLTVDRLTTDSQISQYAVDAAKTAATSIALIKKSTMPNGEVLVQNSLSTGFLFNTKCHVLAPLHSVGKKIQVEIDGKYYTKADGKLDIRGATVDLEFGYQDRAAIKTPMKATVLAFGDMTFDYALLRLERPAPAHIVRTPIFNGTIAEMKEVPVMTIGTPSDVYQYRDPKGVLVVDPRCKVLKETFTGADSSCIGAPGSSGSPILGMVEKDSKTGKETWGILGMVVSGAAASRELLSMAGPEAANEGPTNFLNFLPMTLLNYKAIYQDIGNDLKNNPCR